MDDKTEIERLLEEIKKAHEKDNEVCQCDERCPRCGKRKKDPWRRREDYGWGPR